MEDLTSKVLEIAEKYLGPYKLVNGQVEAKLCPFCHGGKNHDQGTFYVGLYNGAYKCHRGHCDVQGSFADLCKHFGEQPPAKRFDPARIPGTVKKVYDKPDPEKLHPLTDEIKEYFAMRKISEETLNAWKIASDTKGNIVFPFYRDGDLIYVKYREPRKHTKESKLPKEWQETNTEQILFGMDMVDLSKPLVIVEGEIDALSVYEAGMHNVVSVPCGATAMDWVQNCWEWLENFQQIILFGDYDEPGAAMINTLTKRLGEERCMIPDEYPELIVDGEDKGRFCKDANEILYAYGPEKLKELIESCELAPVQGIIDLGAVQYIDPTTIPRIFTRIPELDEAIGGLGEGCVTICSGKRGEGKSTLTGELCLQAIEQGHNVCIYSGELSAHKVFEWLCSQAVEAQYVTTKHDPRNNKVYTYIPNEIQDRVRQWFSQRAYLYDNAWATDQEPSETVLEIFTICAKRYGCSLFLVDNLMSVLCSPEEENKAQARFVAKLKAFATKFNVHVILVAHPRKEKTGTVFTSDSVSGSSAITNLADIVLNVEKPDIRITKNREFGETKLIRCVYNPVNRRIYQEKTGDRTVYSWDHTGIEVPKIQAMKLPQFRIIPREENIPEGSFRAMPF